MTYKVYPDGSAFPNSKLAGWAFVLVGETTIEQSGFAWGGGANRMELLAAINGIEAVPEEGARITVFTDSLFVLDCSKRIFRGRSKHFTPLQLKLMELCKRHSIEFLQVLRGNKPREHMQAHHLARQAAISGGTDVVQIATTID